MPCNRLLILPAALVVFSCLQADEVRELGDATKASFGGAQMPSAVQPQNLNPGNSVININSREEVRGSYLRVYLGSRGVSMDSSAIVAACHPGTNSLEFRQSVQQRINWFRAMAGVPASIEFDPALNAKAQKAALMMSANYDLSHAPPSSWECYSAEGADAAANSNITLGNSGPGAITDYMQDYGGENMAVGHRRWLLYPQTQSMGTGDVPGQGDMQQANATWVIDSHRTEPRPATRTPFVSWPPTGYVPAPVVFPRWSVSHPNADFANTTVTLRSNGVPIEVIVEPPENYYGENTLVWVPMGLNANSPATQFPFSGSDTTYDVDISNIVVGGINTNTSYSVILFDPMVPGPDYIPPTIMLEAPALGSIAVELNFSVLSGDISGLFELWWSEGFPGAWQQDTNATLAAITPGSLYRFTTPRQPSSRFYQVHSW